MVRLYRHVWISETDLIAVFLVSVSQGDMLHVKLGDFGSAVDLRNGPARTWKGYGDYTDPVSISTLMLRLLLISFDRKSWKEISVSIGLRKVIYILLDVRSVRSAVPLHC